MFLPLSDVLRYREGGFSESTDEAPREHFEGGCRYPFVRIVHVPASASVAIADRVDRWIFRAAVTGTMTVKLGREAESLWGQFRERVDSPLARLGLSSHLEQIENGVGARTSAGRRSALYMCRSLLEDLANAIWLDPRDVYTPLRGSGPGGRLDVSRGSTKNRLSAYLHQHLGSTKAEKYLAAELDRLSTSLNRLYDLTNKAHDDQVVQEDAETAVVGTYICIAEIARRTSLVPLTAYVEREGEDEG